MRQSSLVLLLILGLALVALGLMTWPIQGTHSPATETATDAVDTTAADAPKTSTGSTGTTKSPTAPTGAGVRSYENGFYVTTIVLSDSGFTPSYIEIKKGEEVRFVNKTNGIMHISADQLTSSQAYRYINQSSFTAKGGTYQFGLPELGILNYFNLNSNPKRSGQIVVK